METFAQENSVPLPATFEQMKTLWAHGETARYSIYCLSKFEVFKTNSLYKDKDLSDDIIKETRAFSKVIKQSPRPMSYWVPKPLLTKVNKIVLQG